MRRAAVVAAALALAGCAPVSAPEPAPAPLTMTAYQGSWSSPDLIARNADAITVLAVDGINLVGPGEVRGTDAAARAQLEAGHASGLPVELMVGNFDGALDDFSEELAWQTFADAELTVRAAEQTARTIVDEGWDGASVDMESLAERDSAGLTLFVQTLRDELPAEATLSIALMLEDSAEGYARAGYDLAALPVDRFVLMAYDQHGPWDDVPGPIGALDWQRSGAEPLVDVVGADRVELGVAGYGYGWGPSGGTFTVAEARALAGGAAVFDEPAGEWTATLDDGTVLWWSDARSLALRETLARELGVPGLALWSLGGADPLSD